MRLFILKIFDFASLTLFERVIKISFAQDCSLHERIRIVLVTTNQNLMVKLCYLDNDNIYVPNIITYLQEGTNISNTHRHFLF